MIILDENPSSPLVPHPRRPLLPTPVNPLPQEAVHVHSRSFAPPVYRPSNPFGMNFFNHSYSPMPAPQPIDVVDRHSDDMDISPATSGKYKYFLYYIYT